MKCDLCDKPATVHEQTIRAGQVSERHLCETCARTSGICVQPPASLASLITQFFTPAVAAAPAPAKPGPKTAGACAACGLTFAKFKETGLLGCPNCYTTFEQPLMSLLERAHEGGTHHVGKCPRVHAPPPAAPQPHAPAAPPAAAAPSPASSPGPAPMTAGGLAALDKPLAESVEQVRLSLRRLLEKAIKAEDYKEAARLRDHLRRIEEITAPGAPTQQPAQPEPQSQPQPQTPPARPPASPTPRRTRRPGPGDPGDRGGPGGTA